jgi:hypothetical protein
MPNDRRCQVCHDYTEDYWRKEYLKYLLDREETKRLPRLPGQ